jgi:hypothetical protein
MKEHPVYTGYLVTEDGRVFSAWCLRNKNGRLESYIDYNEIRQLKTKISNTGYEEVKLKYTKTNRKIHRLVAETFIENPKNLPRVNHIDENKLNNNVSNLEWVTQQQNTEYSLAKTYIIENVSTKEKFVVFNLRKWCIEKNMHDGSLHNTFTGKSREHKGYRIIEKREKE